MTHDLPLSQFDLPPAYEEDLREALEHAALRSMTNDEALLWLNERGLAIIKEYGQDAITWLADMLKRPAETEGMSERERMFIWIVAYNMHKASPKTLTLEQDMKWIFSLISLGYMMRVDHEHGWHSSGIDSEGGSVST